MELSNNQSPKSLELSETQRKLKSESEIYLDLTKIINAYNKEQELEKDEIFTLNDKFSLSKFSEARKLVSSGKFDSEINNLQQKINNHKYLLQKNEQKDRLMLKDMIENKNKIKLCATLLDTKREWYSILDKNLPKELKGNGGEAMIYNFVQTCKSLSESMENIASRHKYDDDFIKNLNNMLELSAKSNSDLNNGGEAYKYTILLRQDLVNSLEINYNMAFSSNEYGSELINE
mgnify:CR=1 FL=1